MFLAMLFTIGEVWKQPKCSLRKKWMKKMWYMHTTEIITQPYKENEILPFATTWVDLEGIMLSEVS